MALEPAAIEQTIIDFLTDFMNLKVKARDQALGHLLTSIQQFELLLFIEQKFEVEIPPTVFANSSRLTTESLSSQILAKRA